MTPDRLTATPERLARAGKVATTRDGAQRVENHPLDRLRNRRQITDLQWSNGRKLEALWRKAGFAPRVISTLSEPVGGGGAMSAAQAEAHAAYLAAIRAVGIRWSWALCGVCLEGLTLTEAAAAAGKNRKSAIEYLRDGLDALEEHWGGGDG